MKKKALIFGLLFCALFIFSLEGNCKIPQNDFYYKTPVYSNLPIAKKVYTPIPSQNQRNNFYYGNFNRNISHTTYKNPFWLKNKSVSKIGKQNVIYKNNLPYKIGNQRVIYGLNNKIKSIGNKPVIYRNGKIYKIGDLPVIYNNNNEIIKIGNWSVSYNA